MSDVELKPCPFCGYHARSVSRQRAPDSPRLFFVRCESTSCDVEGPLGECELSAKEAWNTRPEEDRIRAALQVAEQRNTELVAETWKLGTEIEERAIEQARLREALQAAERENERVLESALKDAAERELFREERDGAFEKAASIEQQSATLAARLRAEKASMRQDRDAAIARAEGTEQAIDRLAVVADEAFGPFPVQSAEENLTAIEQGVFALRVRAEAAELRAEGWENTHNQVKAQWKEAVERAEKAERERDEAQTEATELRAEVERLRGIIITADGALCSYINESSEAHHLAFPSGPRVRVGGVFPSRMESAMTNSHKTHDTTPAPPPYAVGATVDPRTLPVGAVFRHVEQDYQYRVTEAGVTAESVNGRFKGLNIGSMSAILLSLPTPKRHPCDACGEESCPNPTCKGVETWQSEFGPAHLCRECWGRRQEQLDATIRASRTAQTSPAQLDPCGCGAQLEREFEEKHPCPECERTKADCTCHPRGEN